MNIHKKSLLIFVLIIVITSLILGMAIPVGAQSGNTENRNPQQVIAEIYAERFGVTLDEAIHRLKLQDSFPGLSTALEQNESETFGGLWIQHEPEYKVVIAFTRDGEKTIINYNKYISAEVAPYIEIRTVNKSLIELLNDQKNLVSSLNEQDIKTDSRVDIVNNCVSIDIAKVDENKFTIAQQNGELALTDGLKVEFVNGLHVLATYVYGGLTLDYYSWGSPCCTSGFSVKNLAGTVKGIATTGHGPHSTLYYSGNQLPFEAYRNGGGFDVQWHSSPVLSVTNKIQWWSDGSTFNVNSKKERSEQHVGDIVSKYGITTHYTAGQITSTTLLLPAPYNSPTWIEVYNVFGYTKLVDSGDSGGPWFTGNGSGVTALGITHSYSDDWQYAAYMAQNYIGILGMFVMTSP